MNDEERRLAGRLYNTSALHGREWIEAKIAMDRYNNRTFGDGSEPVDLGRIFAAYGEGSSIIPPLYYSHGCHMNIGKHFFANTGLVVLDETDIVIGDNVFLGPHVSIFTPVHPIDPELRNTGLKIALPVHIGNNVWVGGNVTICPGVTIGDNCVIGAGSVVTKDIEANTVAVGVPCRPMRKIGPEDRARFEDDYQAYLAEEAAAKAAEGK